MDGVINILLVEEGYYVNQGDDVSLVHHLKHLPQTLYAVNMFLLRVSSLSTCYLIDLLSIVVLILLATRLHKL